MSSAPTPAQCRAADPAHSVWVTANAGTGKTRVLSDRVLRLLLDGNDPEGILCLTFTKAAAVEMTTRIEERLAVWATTADDGVLGRELEALTGSVPGADQLTAARRLFAQVLELPRGLGVMTIHALCGSLLRRFPLEAGVAPHFETIDDRSAAELMRDARERVLQEAQRDAGKLGQALELLAVTLSEASLTEALVELLGQRMRLLAARAALGDVDLLVDAIYRALGAEPGQLPGALEEAACADGVYDSRGLLAAANALARGSNGDIERACLIADWLGCAPKDRVRLLPTYRRCFMTVNGGPCAKLGTKEVLHDQVVARVLGLEQARLTRLADQLRALAIARRTEALLRVGFAMIDAYEQRKAQAAALDYDDLIERTRALLDQPGQSGWVMFKLDARIDHVLVDEAQDTSPQQWAIVEQLVAEFFAGAGARPSGRTLFVVGDDKQSIYSFQGADLANFRKVRERLGHRAEAAGQPIRHELLDRSFRSVPAVLELVDQVLALQAARDNVAVRHETVRFYQPGLVELWPLAAPAEPAAAPDPWPLPDRPRVGDDPERRVARAIARAIQGWLASGELLESEGRPIAPGDVLVLVARRGIVQELLIRALKQAGVPVAGADRLTLAEHIAVRDLVACGRALLLPEDDLNLACLLKSPLLGLDEDDLFELAWARGEASLLERLRAAAGSAPARFGQAHERLAAWLQRADFMPPFEFFTWMLGADGGRRRLLARLGPDAIEPIEAFLGQALAYERGHPSSLEGFLHWFGLEADQLKRDPEKARNVVRVVTVHGAKGLEAPIVILADAGPRGQPRPGRLLWGAAEPDGPELPFWRAAKQDREGLTERLATEAELREQEERQRLLYVALTRARDRLYVTGWQSRRHADGDPDPTSWHDLVRQALDQLPGVERFMSGLGRGFDGQGWRLRRGITTAERTSAPPAAEPTPASLPAWALTEVADEPPPLRPMAPSRLAEPAERPLASPGSQLALGQRQRGLLLHRLLQLLPNVPAGERAAAGARLLAALAPDLGQVERAELLTAAIDVLDAPELAALFGPGSRAEQSLAGVVAGHAVMGAVDRMLVTADSVLIVDYKSGRPPMSPPVAYLRQLAAYRSLLQAIYPGRAVRAALLWTEVPVLDELPAILLDSHAPGAGLTLPNGHPYCVE